MKLFGRRGLDWKFAPSNKGDCPRNGVPLWQVLDPLLWGQPEGVRRVMEVELSGTRELWDFLYLTRGGMRYVSFGQSPPTRLEIVSLRRKIYGILPPEIIGSLPDEIRRKYSPAGMKVVA